VHVRVMGVRVDQAGILEIKESMLKIQQMFLEDQMNE